MESVCFCVRNTTNSGELWELSLWVVWSQCRRGCANSTAVAAGLFCSAFENFFCSSYFCPVWIRKDQPHHAGFSQLWVMCIAWLRKLYFHRIKDCCVARLWLGRYSCWNKYLAQFSNYCLNFEKFGRIFIFTLCQVVIEMQESFTVNFSLSNGSVSSVKGQHRRWFLLLWDLCVLFYNIPITMHNARARCIRGAQIMGARLPGWLNTLQ